MLQKLMIGLFCAVLFVDAPAQQTAVSTPIDPMLALPPSDLVMTVDMRRMMDEALPRALVNAPLARAQMNAAIAKVKTQTGFDLRTLDRIVVGMGDFNLNTGTASNKIPGKMVAIATGSFNAPVLVAAVRLAAGGKYREEQYAQSTLYTFELDKGAAMAAGVSPAMPAPEISLVALDAHTLAVGLPASVRAAVDMRNGRGLNAANANLISMAGSNSGTLIGIGAEVSSFMRRPSGTATANRSTKKLELTPLDNLSSTQTAGAANDAAANPVNEISRALEAVRQVFFSVGMADQNFNVHVVARTEQSSQAQELVNMLEAMKGFAGPAGDPKVRKMLDAVKVFAQNNEIQVSADFAQRDVAALLTDKQLKLGPTTRSGQHVAVKRRRRR